MPTQDKVRVDKSLNKESKERLLDSAERLFAEKGYDRTSVRELIGEAQCNIAAVNYHFGGKENLYKAVFKRRMRYLRDVRLESIDRAMTRIEEDGSLEELLHAFANGFIEPLVDQSGGRLFLRLMMREMIDPRLATETFLEEVIRPVASAFQAALCKVCPGLDSMDAFACIRSIVGQLAHAIHMQDTFAKLGPEFEKVTLQMIVDHIVKFSAAGIREYMKEES